MINRRGFLGTLGASAVLSTVPVLGSETVTAGTTPRRRVSLNGDWELQIEGTPWSSIAVPSSSHPLGLYTLKRTFLLPRLGAGERAFIHFEAITYCGKLAVDGKLLGVLGPYIPYEFEFTDVAREGQNAIEIQMADLVPFPDGTGQAEIALGVNPGWEAYGGIVRDVWVEIRPVAFIENVRLSYQLARDFQTVALQPQVTLASATSVTGQLEIVLSRNGAELARASQPAQLKSGTNTAELALELKAPALWSPDQPNLYELRANLKTASAEDSWSCRTGFRDIHVEGREFRLNGERLILNGVCRHDMWKEQGFTLTCAQQEQDMRMIKALGCNFVRLVHYPHDRHIVELADELGLLVSEEPGYWNMDFRTMPRPEVELGFQILEATIRRDWNSPSVMAWLLSNECHLTEAVLAEGKQRCNRLDPIKRLVSAANSMGAAESKPLFVAADMDFFDQHPYTYDVQDFDKEAQFDGPGKPLTFTEWGGKAIGQSPLVMRNEVDRLIKLVDSGELSGHVFWSWQDMRQYSRIDAEMRDGVLESGVVTEAREPRHVVWMELSRLFQRRYHVDEQPNTAPELVPLQWSPWRRKSQFAAVDLQPLVDSAESQRAWNSLKGLMAKYWQQIARDQWKMSREDLLLWTQDKVQIGGVDFQMPVANRHVRPLVVTPQTPELVVPLNRRCNCLHILGQVSLTNGFPITGKDGEQVGAYVFEYSNGHTKEIALRNGYEVAQANIIQDATRINPEATESQRALLFVKDTAREHYQVLLYSLPVEDMPLVRIRFRLKGEQSPLALFAITSETFARA
jgi:hypothetical protein